MKPEEIIKVVIELNDDLFEDESKLYENGVEYSYSTDGYVNLVKFCGYVVYNSDDSSEKEIEKAGGFKQFLVKERNDFIRMLSKIKVSHY